MCTHIFYTHMHTNIKNIITERKKSNVDYGPVTSTLILSSSHNTIYLGCSSGRSMGYEAYHRASLWEASYSLWVRHLVLLLLKFISGLGSVLGLSGSLMPSFLAFFCTWDRALYSKSQTWRWCSEPFLCSTPFGWKNPPLILEKEYQA